MRSPRARSSCRPRDSGDRHRTSSRPNTGHDVHVCGFPYPFPRPMAWLCSTAGVWSSARRSVSTASRSYRHPPFRVTRRSGPRFGLAGTRHRTSRQRSLLNHVSSCENKARMGYSRNRSCAGQRPAARVGLGGPDPCLTCGFCSVDRRSTPVKEISRRLVMLLRTPAAIRTTGLGRE
jgi:hypothetical protein